MAQLSNDIVGRGPWTANWLRVDVSCNLAAISVRPFYSAKHGFLKLLFLPVTNTCIFLRERSEKLQEKCETIADKDLREFIIGTSAFWMGPGANAEIDVYNQIVEYQLNTYLEVLGIMTLQIDTENIHFVYPLSICVPIS